MRYAAAVLVCVSLTACARRSQSELTPAAEESDATAVHAAATLIDAHNDVTSDTIKGLNLAERRRTGHTDVPRLKAGGVDAVFFAAYVAASYARQGKAAQRALQMIDTVRHDIVAKNARHFSLATRAEHVGRANNEGRIAALIGIEGGHAIEDDLRLLRTYHNLGVRYMTLTHSNTNNWADSSGDIDDPAVKHHGGLTAFGKEVIAEMNRIGMMIDISHVSDETFWDVLETSRAPVFASHSSCRALCNIARNMTDEMIAALAKNGGAIQINFGCEFVSQKSADASSWASRAIRDRLRKMPEAERRKAAAEIDARMPRASLDQVVAHIDHAVKVAGVDGVGIGTDFDGVTCTPEGLDDVSKFPNLTRALIAKGYTAVDIHKIYGGNLLRVMHAVESAAGK
jgi:membrane dipeptidase